MRAANNWQTDKILTNNSIVIGSLLSFCGDFDVLKLDKVVGDTLEI
jgi:hypothetical protein